MGCLFDDGLAVLDQRLVTGVCAFQIQHDVQSLVLHGPLPEQGDFSGQLASHGCDVGVIEPWVLVFDTLPSFVHASSDDARRAPRVQQLVEEDHEPRSGKHLGGDFWCVHASLPPDTNGGTDQAHFVTDSPPPGLTLATSSRPLRANNWA